MKKTLLCSKCLQHLATVPDPLEEQLPLVRPTVRKRPQLSWAYEDEVWEGAQGRESFKAACLGSVDRRGLRSCKVRMRGLYFKPCRMWISGIWCKLWFSWNAGLLFAQGIKGMLSIEWIVRWSEKLFDGISAYVYSITQEKYWEFFETFERVPISQISTWFYVLKFNPEFQQN